MRKHVALAAFAIASALASPAQTLAKLPPGGIIVCDRQGCRPEPPPAARPAAASHGTKAARTPRPRARTRNAHQRASLAVSGPGVVRSRATGATAEVAARYAARFQAYVDDLEAHGAKVYYMGGIRPGRCSPGSQHPCGSALDVCQDWRGHVSGLRDCHLPPPVEMAAIARSHGLNEGGVWCRRPDYGHAQIERTGSVCTARGSWGHGTGRIYSARRHRRHRHLRIAGR